MHDKTTNLKSHMVHVVFALVLFVGILCLQWLGGAWDGEFGDNPDEAGHFITGLMIRDYIANGFPGSPMSFATDYYFHYPKVALGHWPPVFYLAQTAWTLLAGSSRFSLMLFMAVNTWLLAFTVFLCLRKETGVGGAIAASLFLVLLPKVQEYTGVVMYDVFGSWLCVVAAILFGRYLNTGKTRDSVLFGVVSAMAILTRAGSIELALVPPLAMLFVGRLRLLKSPSLWVSVLIVALLCGPWYWFAFDMMKNGFENPQGLQSSVRAVGFYFPGFVRVVGWALFVPAVVGFVDRVVLRGREEGSGIWVSMAALMISAPVFHSVVTNAYDTRYLIPALPPFVMFVAAGVRMIAGRLNRGIGLPLAVPVVWLVLALLFSFSVFTIPAERNKGMLDAVRQVLDGPDDAPAWLVCSDPIGEGMAIANVALNEKRPCHYIFRGSKLLASSMWDGSGYSLKYFSTSEIADFLKNSPISILVLDDSVPPGLVPEHQIMLTRTVGEFPEQFRLVDTFPSFREGMLYPSGLKLYALVREGDLDESEMRSRLDALRNSLPSRL